jgi:hypothetical protein
MERACARGSPDGHGWPAEWARTTPKATTNNQPATSLSVWLKKSAALSRTQKHRNHASATASRPAPGMSYRRRRRPWRAVSLTIDHRTLQTGDYDVGVHSRTVSRTKVNLTLTHRLRCRSSRSRQAFACGLSTPEGRRRRCCPRRRSGRSRACLTAMRAAGFRGMKLRV